MLSKITGKDYPSPSKRGLLTPVLGPSQGKWTLSCFLLSKISFFKKLNLDKNDPLLLIHLSAIGTRFFKRVNSLARPPSRDETKPLIPLFTFTLAFSRQGRGVFLKG